jgi:5'-3' exonuclease
MKILIVDGNNLSYRLFIKMYECGGLLRTNTGVATTVTYGLIRTINAFIDNMKVDRCIICWDGGSKYRKKVFKHYKGHREKPDWGDAYYEELNSAREYLGKMGLVQGYVRGIEADDIIGYLTAKLSEDKHKIIIFSDDKDFFQLGKYKARYYRPTKMHLIDDYEAEEMLGYPTKLLPKIVALTGEKKDNIPGAGDLDENHIMTKIGLGPVTALKLLDAGDRYKSVKELIDTIDPSNKFAPMIKKNRKQILRSYKLSRIRTKDKFYADWELDALEDIYSKIIIDSKVKRSKINMLKEFLEFRSVNLLKMLINLGVNTR